MADESGSFSNTFEFEGVKIVTEIKAPPNHLTVMMDKAHGSGTRQRITRDEVFSQVGRFDTAGESRLIRALNGEPAEGANQAENLAADSTALDVEKLAPRKLGELLALLRDATEGAKLELTANASVTDDQLVTLKGSFAGGQEINLQFKMPMKGVSGLGATSTALDDEAGGAEVVAANGAATPAPGMAWKGRLTSGDDPDNFNSRNGQRLVKTSVGIINVVAGCGIINFGVNVTGAVLFHNQISPSTTATTTTNNDTDTSTTTTTSAASPTGASTPGAPVIPTPPGP